MKSLMFALTFLLAATTAWAQDPRDSIIIESKCVGPNLSGSPAFGIRVYITNKDSLGYMVLSLKARTISGSGYALLNRNANGQFTFASIVQPLGLFGQFYTAKNMLYYDDASPDSFLVAGGSDGTPETAEPPNAVRKPVWELKFRHSSDSVGEIGFYNSPNSPSYPGSYFTIVRHLDVVPNFLSGVLTVTQKGDLNCGGDDVTGADIVWEIRCVLGGETPPAGRSACDLNCDGALSAADIITMITYNFVTLTWPC